MTTMQLSENARTIFDKRYSRKDADGGPTESPEETVTRVAENVASVTVLYGESATAHPNDSGAIDFTEWPFRTAVRQARYLGWEPRFDGEDKVPTKTYEEFVRIADEYEDMLLRRDFFPNSPTWTGAGTQLGQLAACFVLPVEDDLAEGRASIFETLRVAAAIQQTGGGNGFSFTRLRPGKALVTKSMGQASGPVGFLHTYDAAFGWIGQGGTRRGANMGVLRVDHPDIEHFIEAKVEEGKVSNFNISVAVTDEFMEAVDKDADFTLRWAPTGQSDDPVDYTIERTIKARDLYDRIIECAWKLGDPGNLFIDKANATNPCPSHYVLEATNPCVTGDTWVMTDQGARQIWSLEFGSDEPGPVPKVVVDGKTYSARYIKTGVKPVLTLATKEGYSLRLTADHRVMTPEGWREAGELRAGDKIRLHDHGTGLSWVNFEAQEPGEATAWGRDEGYLAGLFVGDGTMSGPVLAKNFVLNAWVADRGHESVMEEADEAARRYMERFNKRVRSDWRGWTGPYGNGWYRLSARALDGLLYHFGTSDDAEWGFATAEYCSSDFYCGFLRGLFDADGHVETGNGGPNVRLTQSNLDLLRMVQRMLLRLGMFSRIYPVKSAGTSLLPDGHGGVKEYEVRESWRLVVSGASAHTFMDRIGFGNAEKMEGLKALVGNMVRGPYRQVFEATVDALIPDGEEEVFDAQVEEVHAFDANGLYVHNCGEQWLPPYSNCCLGSINLANFAKWSATDEDDQWNPTFDWTSLYRTVHLAQNFLDDVVDANQYVPVVPELEAAAMAERRIGLGIMGLADAMAIMGIGYDTDEGREFAAQVQEFVSFHTYIASALRARDRGPFEWFEDSIYNRKPDSTAVRGLDGQWHPYWTPPTPLEPFTHDFGRPRVNWADVVDLIKQHGLRNACLLTIAPTGTISNVADLQGSGCETFFALIYDRVLTQEEQRITLSYANPLFHEALRRSGKSEADIETIVGLVKANKGSCQGIPEVPFAVQAAFPVAADVTATGHVKMQAALQRFVDNSISKTINLPFEATEEDVSVAYRLAYQLGCKGITIYRQGSRQIEVLSTGGDKPGDNADDWPYVQPHSIPGYAYQEGLPSLTFPVPTPFGTAQVYLTELREHPGRPFDVRLGFGKAGNDKLADVEAIGRMISIALRAGVPVEVVVDQLQGIGGQSVTGFGPQRVRSVPDGVAKLLRRRYMPDDAMGTLAITPSQSKDEVVPVADPTLVCPDCHQASVVNESGCQHCDVRLGGCGGYTKCD